MEINENTAASLGEKLAELDLSAEEGVLLATLIAATPEDDVSGFVTLQFTEVEVMGRHVLGPLPGAWKVEEGQIYLKIEL